MFEPIIVRNTTIPCWKSKVFTTALDNQDMVRVHVFQGEREMSEDNKSLGIVEMRGLPPAPRGVPEIEVIFELDSNGILNVHARDRGTGRQQSSQIVSNSGLSMLDIEEMILEAESHRAADRDRRALAEERNHIDGLIYTTRRSLEEYAASVGAADAMQIARPSSRPSRSSRRRTPTRFHGRANSWVSRRSASPRASTRAPGRMGPRWRRAGLPSRTPRSKRTCSTSRREGSPAGYPRPRSRSGPTRLLRSAGSGAKRQP